MDYEAFFKDVLAWINQANKLAAQYGMESSDFWSWVTRSTGQIGDKYNNNPLVIKQMVMLHEWLDEIYFNSKKQGARS